jgi:hypothetical protein
MGAITNAFAVYVRLVPGGEQEEGDRWLFGATLYLETIKTTMKLNPATITIDSDGSGGATKSRNINGL